MINIEQYQSLSLNAKITLSTKRIREWYEHWEGKVYVSFSGGKDSTVLLHLVRSIYPDVKAVFVDTGLEYPEIRDFVKSTENVEWLRPKKTFQEVIKKYGYPVVSKDIARSVESILLKRNRGGKPRELNGGYTSGYTFPKRWYKLLHAPFKISQSCCYHMKKAPLKKYQKKAGLKPFIGMMAADSKKRNISLRKTGCNSFTTERSNPLSFWLEKDVWQYLKENNVTYSTIYDMGYQRTGCMFCMFGVHLEKSPNRFELMEKTHPKHYKYCMDTLGLRDILEWLEVKGFTRSLFKGEYKEE